MGVVNSPKNETARNAVENPVMNQAALRAVQNRSIKNFALSKRADIAGSGEIKIEIAAC